MGYLKNSRDFYADVGGFLEQGCPLYTPNILQSSLQVHMITFLFGFAGRTM